MTLAAPVVEQMAKRLTEGRRTQHEDATAHHPNATDAGQPQRRPQRSAGETEARGDAGADGASGVHGVRSNPRAAGLRQLRGLHAGGGLIGGVETA